MLAGWQASGRQVSIENMLKQSKVLIFAPEFIL